MKKRYSKDRRARHGAQGGHARHAAPRTRRGRGSAPASRRTPAPMAPAPSSRWEDAAVVEGRFRGTSRGFGFVTPLEDIPALQGEDIFIPAFGVGDTLDGDRVRVRYHMYEAHQNGQTVQRSEGRIEAVLEAAHRMLIGTLRCRIPVGMATGQEYYLVPDNPRIPGEIGLPGPGTAAVGDKVSVWLVGARHGAWRGRVVRSFGAAESRRANADAILSDLQVRIPFPREVEEEAARVAAEPLSEEGRTRLTREVIFTMDGASAKDLDDAVSLRYLPGGRYLLGVHIADVSAYVRPGTALDAEAMLRGTSLYFADRVVPMLPQALSNGVCSLHAGEDKYALSAYMTLSPEGEILSTRVEKTIIRSRVRGVYEEVNDLLAQGARSPYAAKYRPVLPTLQRMQALYAVLEARSRRRGALEFDRPEPLFVLDAEGEVTDITTRARGVAECMIEQFMLVANEGVATLMQSRGIPCVYRVHDRPEATRLSDFRTYVHNLGLSVAPLMKEDPTSADFAAVLAEGEEKGLGRALSYTVLRTMAKAVYRDKPGAHFGLGIACYCHFTSPIRRLSDLATHRILKAVLFAGEAPARYAAYAGRAATAATDGEARALEAERQIEALFKTAYMAGAVGEERDGCIASVTSFGLFVELEDTCEGLVALEDLPGDLHFDEATLTLSGRQVQYRIGQAVRVRVLSADIAARRVRFALL